MRLVMPLNSLEAFSLDLTVVETVAHMRSSVKCYGDIDIICDIGGQDIKVLFLRNGRVIDFKLNTQCSAGNGYFLQSMAEQFGIPIEQYADKAFSAKKAPIQLWLCGVYRQDEFISALGFSKEEIMAGLALVLPKYLELCGSETNFTRFGKNRASGWNPEKPGCS